MKNNVGVNLKILEIGDYKPLDCHEYCDNHDDCFWVKYEGLGKGNTKDVFLTFCVVEIQNLKDKKVEIENCYFNAIDSEGYSYKSQPFKCNTLANRRNAVVEKHILQPHSKVKFLVAFHAKNIFSIIYDSQLCKAIKDYEYAIAETSSKRTDILEDDYREEIYKRDIEIDKLKEELEEKESLLKTLLSKIKGKDKEITSLKHNVSCLENDIEGYINDYNDLKESKGSKFTRVDKDLLCKYKFVEDDDYFRIISLEEETVSFNREFDKTKSNYNWINKGDALISLHADNAYGFYVDGRTLIQSPVSGVFEFDRNKLIGFNEEICRIRKYPQEEKESVISMLEEEDIKQSIYKKERKKMLERQILDELIAEGKVFNVYTKKDGNRSTIPQDIANAVWNRDGGKCCYCGSRENLEFDHIIPVSKGGATTFRNLQLLCKKCNIIKSDNI